MKKLAIALALAALFSTAAHAQSIDFGGDMSNGGSKLVENLENGYYDLTLQCTNTAASPEIYAFGSSNSYSMSSTVIPKTDSQPVKITVKGIGVSDGKCTVGVSSDGSGSVQVISADLVKSDKFSFITGGDMTEVSYIESLGGKYKDKDGNDTDVFDFLGENGVNMARIRLSNNPGKGRGDGTYYLPDGFQNEEDCLKLSKRAKDAGMGIQFTFNYSDYWSNGERQIIPSDWVEAIKADLGYDVKDAAFLNSMTDAQKKQIQKKLGDLVYEYTFDIMTKLKNQDTLPEYVSLGNEINGGVLFPFANTFAANMNKNRFELVYDDKTSPEDIKCYEDWAGLTSILNRGYDAVKAVSPSSQVVIHLANGSKDSVYTWFFDKYKKAGGKFDVIGASYYPAWSENPIETCVSFCNNISKKYNKDILIMETGYNWSSTKKNGFSGQLTANAPGYNEKYPFTQEGHSDFTAALINALKGVDGGRCAGILYWDPCMIHVEDSDAPNESLSGWAYREDTDKPDGNVVENTTLFDFDGRAIKSVDVFKNSKNSALAIHGTMTVTDNQDGTKTASAAVDNSKLTPTTAALYVVLYDGENKISSVKMDTHTFESAGSCDLSITFTGNNYKTFLWDGETLAPINK